MKFKNAFFCALLCNLYSISCCAVDVWTPPQLISQTYSFTYDSVFNSCDTITGQFLATWVDQNNNQYPTYSFYSSGTGWSAIDTISTSSQALFNSNAFTSFDSASGKFLATWTDMGSKNPTTSIYTPGVGWSPADLLTTSLAAENTVNSCNSDSQFLVTWADRSTNLPKYSFYDINSGWGTAATITMESIADNVYTAFNPAANQFLAVWTDIGTGVPMYSLYTSGAWSAAAPIAAAASVDNDVYCCFNPVTGQFLAAWSDINQNLYPFYSFYTEEEGWTPSETITITSGVTDNVAVSCNLATGAFLATWSNVSNGNPTYSFYTPGTGWESPSVISSTAITGSDVITSFNPLLGQFLATWADRSNADLIFDPTYSFFGNIPSPPSKFNGTVLYNRFLNQTDIIHQLFWTPSSDPSIVSYQISRNGIVIAVVPASSPNVYYDHNRSNKVKDVYTIVSQDSDGNQSASVSITL